MLTRIIDNFFHGDARNEAWDRALDHMNVEYEKRTTASKPEFRKEVVKKLDEKGFEKVESKGFYEFWKNDNEDYFVIRDSLFVFLDTEQAIISGEQANFLTEVAEKHQGMKNLFVFTHKLFWRKQNPDSYLFRSRPLKVMLDKSSPVTCFIGERFLADNIYIMSGDINKKWLLPLLYAQSGKMKFFAVGNGDTVNDALLSVKVDSNDDVKFELLSLTGKLLNQPDNYNIAKKDFYSTNLSRMTFVRKIYYFIKYPFHLALLLALFALFVILFLANKIRKQH